MAHRKAAISRAIAAAITGGFLPAATEAAITGAQSHLRLPGDIKDCFRQPLEAYPEGLADPGGVAIGPSSLDQRSPGASIASERQTRAPDCIAGRALSWNESQKRHQLRRVSKRRTSPISAAKIT